MEEMKEYSIVEAISLFTHKWKGVMLLVGIIYWACAWALSLPVYVHNLIYSSSQPWDVIPIW